MPKLIDYPRTSYAGAWELAEITDDTGGKCGFDTAARKLNRKVSGSFKAIIGSAVKFGLVTSKRDLLTTTTLFKRVKHAYDKQEELLFHREAFLTPPLFTQICRKFRSRELPVQMLDVMLIREFGVEEINAQGVAKAFVEGCRAVGLLDERNIIADIDALNAQRQPRRELANAPPAVNSFRPDATRPAEETATSGTESREFADSPGPIRPAPFPETFSKVENAAGRPDAFSTFDFKHPDAIASLFGIDELATVNQPTTVRASTIKESDRRIEPNFPMGVNSATPSATVTPIPLPVALTVQTDVSAPALAPAYQLQVNGPGVNTALSITEEEDITIAIALLEKIRRQLKA